MGLFKSLFNKQNLPINYWQFDNKDSNFMKRYEDRGAGAGIITNPDVSSAINLISSTISTLKFNLLLENEIIGEPRNLKIGGRSNRLKSTTSFIKGLINTMLINGDAFAMYDRVSKELFEVDAVVFNRAENGTVFYTVNPSLQNQAFGITESKNILPKDILHIRYGNPSDKISHRGTSILESLTNVEYIQKRGLESISSFFSNIITPSATLESDLVLKKEQVEQLRSAFADSTATSGVPILTAGMKYNQIKYDAFDIATINLLRYNSETIYRAFGIPTAIIGLGSTENAESSKLAMKQWIDMSLKSMIYDLSSELQKILIDNDDNYIRIEPDMLSIARPNQVDLSVSLGNMLRAGILTINEARDLSGIPLKSLSIDEAMTSYYDQPMPQSQQVPLLSRLAMKKEEIDIKREGLYQNE